MSRVGSVGGESTLGALLEPFRTVSRVDVLRSSPLTRRYSSGDLGAGSVTLRCRRQKGCSFVLSEPQGVGEGSDRVGVGVFSRAPFQGAYGVGGEARPRGKFLLRQPGSLSTLTQPCSERWLLLPTLAQADPPLGRLCAACLHGSSGPRPSKARTVASVRGVFGWCWWCWSATKRTVGTTR